MRRFGKRAAVVIGAASFLLSTAACGSDNGGGDGTSGEVAVDGSSTVYPMSNTAAELLAEENSNIEVSVGFSGTGGGFKAFCEEGRTDISNASRPIKDEEAAACADSGTEYTELLVATDALTVVVHPDLEVQCITVDQLKRIFGPDDPATNWRDLDPSFPDVKITGFIPGTDSGTYDYMNADVVQSEQEILREDFESSEDDNVLVQGVAGTQGAVGFFGYSYYEENTDTLKALEIDSGAGCVAPSAETAQSGDYTPLARPLFIYLSNAAYADNAAVKEYVDFYIENLAEIAEIAQFIPLNDSDYAATKSAVEALG